MTKKNLKSTWITKLKKNLTTELAIVYLTSDDTKFLDEYEAVIYEASLNETETTNRRWIEMKTKIAEIVCDILKEKQWGIFFKNEPMQSLPVQDNSSIFKINEVKSDEMVDAIKQAMEERMTEWQNQAEKENQTQNELSSGTNMTLKDTD